MTDRERMGAMCCERHRFLELHVGHGMNRGDLTILNDIFNCRRCWLLDPWSHVALLRMGGNGWLSIVKGIAKVVLGIRMPIVISPEEE